jgi:hypothetical protein
MAKLIVGRFDDVEEVKRAIATLAAAGFAREDYGTFYSSPPGQHQLYPIGGDAHSDEGAKDAGSGAATGVSCAPVRLAASPRSRSDREERHRRYTGFMGVRRARKLHEAAEITETRSSSPAACESP